jgi:hypothetical protein
MARQKGSPKYGGRAKGTPNVTTKEAREIINSILFAELDNIAAVLSKLRENDPARYLELFAKLLVYSLPRRTDVTSDDEAIPRTFIVTAMNQDEATQIDNILKEL